MSTSAPGFGKTYFGDCKKSKIKCAYTYRHSKDMVEILEENMLYF
jgi:hypothetical protein